MRAFFPPNWSQLEVKTITLCHVSWRRWHSRNAAAQWERENSRSRLVGKTLTWASERAEIDFSSFAFCLDAPSSARRLVLQRSGHLGLVWEAFGGAPHYCRPPPLWGLIRGLSTMPSLGRRAPLLFHYQRRPPSAAGSPRTGRPQPSHSSPSVAATSQSDFKKVLQLSLTASDVGIPVDRAEDCCSGTTCCFLFFVFTFVFLDTRTVVLECWPQDWRSARRDPCILGLQLVFSWS